MRNGIYCAVLLSAAACRSASSGLQQTTDQPSAGGLDFGQVPVGGARTLPLPIVDIGFGSCTVTGISGSSGLSVALPTPVTIAAGASAPPVAQVTFSPTQAGPFNGTLTLSYVAMSGDGKPHTVTSPATGIGVAAADTRLEVAPLKVPFGPVLVRQFVQQTVYVKNLNGFPVTLDSYFDGGLATDLLLQDFGDAGLTLAGGQTTNLPIAFAPRSEESVETGWQIGACAGCPHQTVAVSGQGVGGQIVFDPPAVNFGFVLNNSLAPPITVTATVRANTPVTITGPPSAGANSVFTLSNLVPSAPGYQLSADGGLNQATFQVNYSPSGLPNGDFGTVTLPYSISGAPGFAALRVSGDVLSGGCQLQIQPQDGLAFGVLLPGTSASRLLEVTNVGAADCELKNPGLAAGSDPAFSLGLDGGPSGPLTMPQC